MPKTAKKSPAAKSVRATPTRRASAPRDDADGAIAPQAAPSQHNGHSKDTIADNPILLRGKDLLSEDAGGIATAAAIGIGAALIEIELVPGLIGHAPHSVPRASAAHAAGMDGTSHPTR